MWSGEGASPVDVGVHGDAFGAIDHCAARTPSGGVWVVCLAYELGHVSEPTTRGEVEGEVVFRMWLVREPEWIEDPWGACAEGVALPSVAGVVLRSTMGRAGYEAAVARAVAYTHAGDVFQANIAHALRGAFDGDALALTAVLFDRLRPAMGCAVVGGAHGDGGVVSVSPELFLRYDAASRGITTRPIKGTAAIGDVAGLEASVKDRAELAMIVDLLRNDLGRVARVGSVRVTERRGIEAHHDGPGGGGVAHAVAEVVAELRGGETLGGLLRATMSPGSVTGAPKVRAMQIIDELERGEQFAARGAYCGAMGVVDDLGNASLSVAIRTLTLAGGVLELPVGAGIVADSQPSAEWMETLTKAKPIVEALGARLEDV